MKCTVLSIAECFTYIYSEHDTDCTLSPNPAEAGMPIVVKCLTPYHGRWAPVVDCYSDALTDAVLTGKSYNPNQNKTNK